MSSQFSMAFESEDQSIFCAVLFVFRMYYQNDGLEGLDLNGGRRYCPFCLFAVGRCPFPHVALRIYSPNTPQTWPPILTELVGINNYLNSKILTLRPCRRTLWQSQASCLLPCRLDNILIGSVACCVLLFDFCFANIVCWGVYWLNGF